MNPYKHSEISVKRRGGQIEDYYAIHSFVDSTKELCSDNSHRILHNLWGIRRIVIPIFGPTILNSDGKQINVKDLIEQDHILPDYGNRFIPTLFDFVDAMKEVPLDLSHVEQILKLFDKDLAAKQLLLSPLSITGELKSLLITHNSWFLNQILPLVLNRQALLLQFNIRPQQIFEQMEFKQWMNNGAEYPKSAQNIEHLLTYGLFD